MVDCRVPPGADSASAQELQAPPGLAPSSGPGASPANASTSIVASVPLQPTAATNAPANGAVHQSENHQNQQAGGGGDMASHGITSPSSVRASTPSNCNTITTYAGAMNPSMSMSPVYGMGGMSMGGVGQCAPYVCGVKSLVWCPPPPLPPGVNPNVYKSIQTNGSDLPMNDIPTLRYYFNLGVDCTWAAFGMGGSHGGPPPPPHPTHPHHVPPPPPHHAMHPPHHQQPAHVAPPRHYSPRELHQDMQQLNIHDRPNMNHSGEQNHKHKGNQSNDKPSINQGKGNGQRPLLGPRFKRGNNQDGNQHPHNNKGHNNMGNKGPNNRRNSYTDIRNNQPPMHYGPGMEGECVMEQPLLTIPYIPYPPPMYPVPYYQVEADPAMMGMMGGMGYVSYEESVDYGAYYPGGTGPAGGQLPPPPAALHHYPPPHPPLLPPPQDHK